MLLGAAQQAALLHRVSCTLRPSRTRWTMASATSLPNSGGCFQAWTRTTC